VFRHARARWEDSVAGVRGLGPDAGEDFFDARVDPRLEGEATATEEQPHSGCGNRSPNFAFDSERWELRSTPEKAVPPSAAAVAATPAPIV